MKLKTSQLCNNNLSAVLAAAGPWVPSAHAPATAGKREEPGEGPAAVLKRIALQEDTNADSFQQKCRGQDEGLDNLKKVS